MAHRPRWSFHQRGTSANKALLGRVGVRHIEATRHTGPISPPWAYSVLHKVPGFDCRELGFMPAPAPKALWQAQTEQEWNTKYVHWLSRWSGQIYLQAEFDHIQPGAVLSPRAEKWLGEADEFGFIMVSIRKSFFQFFISNELS
jgi:hypothetical protein